ncbi:MAG TPA: VOC family protein [Balneolaceae bacterium]|nr:VOC family protein [Balneolaceae bacterium]
MSQEKVNTITPCLWFDDRAEEAANFYTSLFEASAVNDTSYYGEAGYEVHRHEAGTVLTVDFELFGQPFMILNGVPNFTFTPAISFFVNCQTVEEVDELWAKFSEGGTPLMPLDSYPFSEKYGWIQDKYGLSWQLILREEEIDQKIVPSLMFVGEQAGRAEEAMNFYAEVFSDSKIGDIARYGAGQEPNEEGTVMYADFTLMNQRFAAMDSAQGHAFTFNEAVSLVVNCQTQAEIDDYWEKLSAYPDAEQCGWLKDKFGVSWQIIPENIGKLFSDHHSERYGRVMNAMLKMKKMDIKALEDAYRGKPVAK